jgi:dTMP kinase
VLIAFEGGEGSGKSTQIEALATSLRAAGRSVLVSHEPGATSVGLRIRDLVLHTDEKIAPRAEALLFAADRAHHVHTVVRPALESGQVVLLDRFIDSSLAYQGAGRELLEPEIRDLSLWATGGLRPELTVVLDIPALDGLARARGRSGADRLERESLEFHDRVRRAYLRLAAAEPDRYLVLDATRGVVELSSEIGTVVTVALAARGEVGPLEVGTR